MPLTLMYSNVSNLSLCGLPFFSGFYSSDLIVEILSMSYYNFFIYVIFYLSIVLTVSHSFRITYFMIFGPMNFYSLNMMFDSSTKMLISSGIMFFFRYYLALFYMSNFYIPHSIILPLFMMILTFLIFTGMDMGLEISKIQLSYKL